MGNLKKIFSVALKYLLFLGLGILLVWLAVKNLTEEDLIQIKNSFSKVNYWVIALSCLVGMLSHVARALRWNMLLEPMGKTPSTINSLLAILTGYLANLAVPRLGEFTRCGVLKKYEDIPVQQSFGTVVTERIIDSLSLLVFMGMLLLFQFDVYFGYLDNNVIQPLKNNNFIKLSPSVITLLVCSLIIMIIGTILFLKKKKRTPAKETTNSGGFKLVLLGFLKGIVSVKDVKNKGLLITYSILIWLLYLSTSVIAFKSLPETAHLGMLPALALLVWGTFGFILTQGGLGSYPIIAQFVLAIYGISSNTAFAMGWIIWLAQTIVIIFFGALAFFLLPLINKSVKHELQAADSK